MRTLSPTMVAGQILVILLLLPSARAKTPNQTGVVDLGDAQRARCLQILRRGFQSDDFWPSIHAAEGLIAAGLAQEIRKDLHARLMSEQDDQHRCGLARELVRAGERSMSAELFRVLAAPKSDGHTHACESLYKVFELGDGRLLRRSFEQREHQREAMMAAAALGRWGNPLAMKYIRQQFNDQDSETTRIAAWILARIGTAVDIAPLSKSLATCSDPLSRAYIQHALAMQGDANGIKSLLANLSHADPAVRTSAATFAGELRSPLAFERLWKLLDDDSTDTQIRAAHSLIELGSPAPPDHQAVIRTDVFEASKEFPRLSEGSIVERQDGSLLYATTQFLGSASDFGRAQIVAKTSNDQGRHWSEMRVLQKNVGNQNVMSVTFRILNESSRNNRSLAMFYLVKDSPAALHVWMRTSNDQGRSFGAPRRVTDGDGYFVMNNDRICKLHSGRLIAPVSWTSDVKKVNHFRVRCYYSDDDGKRWQHSGDLDYEKRGAMEPEVVELANGDLLMIVRTQLGHIAASTSVDQGLHWTPLKSWGIVSPESPSTLRVIPSTGDLLLVWNNQWKSGAGHGGLRTPLVASISQDQGESWLPPIMLEDSSKHTFAYTSLVFSKGRAMMSYYVRDEQTKTIGSRFHSIPIRRLYEPR